MVSLDPELSKLFLVLMSTRHSSGPQNGPTFPNFRKQKLKTSFLQHESKIEDSLRFFPDKRMDKCTGVRIGEILFFALSEVDPFGAAAQKLANIVNWETFN